MTIKAVFRFSVASSVLAVLGCGGGGGSKMTTSDFCSQKAQKECDAVASKCSATADACKTARMTACTEWVATQQSASRPFQTDKVSACVNKAGQVFAKAPITPADRAELDDVCARVFSGKLKDGDACANTYECDVNLICDPALSVCAQVKNVSTDAFCANPGETCPTSQYCMTSGAVRKCVNRPGMGAACSADMPCLDTFRCDATTSTCKEKIDSLGACTMDSDCVPAFPYCDPYFNNTCDNGFTPTRGARECEAFGAPPDATGTGGSAGGGGAGGDSGGGGAGGDSGGGGAGGV